MRLANDNLEPQTFGEFVDALIIVNIRMWHAQETVYEIETLEKLTHGQMFDFLKNATWLNLMRNRMMDNLDSTLAVQLQPGKGDELKTVSIKQIDDQSQIWEQA